jgi:hypothetical protein
MMMGMSKSFEGFDIRIDRKDQRTQGGSYV